jgi:hypothetical protein
MRFHLKRREPRDTRPRLPPDEVAWIAEARRSFDDYSVGSLVPVVFDRFARILHPAWSAAHGPVRWDVAAAWSGRTAHALAQWELLSVPITGATQAPPFIAPPDTGGLPRASLAALSTVLASHTSTPDRCYVGVWEGYGWPVAEWSGPEVLDLENRSFHVRRGPISIAIEIGWHPTGDEVLSEPPTLMWPADRAWFVASDTDLDSTYLGGSGPLVDSLLACPELEVWPVTATDDISIGSDHINAR